MHTKPSNISGFTLLELLIVIAIIGILASIASVGFVSVKKTTRDDERLTDIAQIQIALEMFYMSCRQYPATLTDTNNAGACTKSLGKFIDLPIKDPQNVDYADKYATDVPKSDYVLGVKLELNRKELEEDVDGDNYGVDCGDATADTIYCVTP